MKPEQLEAIRAAARAEDDRRMRERDSEVERLVEQALERLEAVRPGRVRSVAESDRPTCQFIAKLLRDGGVDARVTFSDLYGGPSWSVEVRR